MKGKLIKVDGSDVSIGDQLTSFRGEIYTVRDWHYPPSKDKSGKITVIDEHGAERLFNINVFHLKWGNEVK